MNMRVIATTTELMPIDTLPQLKSSGTSWPLPAPDLGYALPLAAGRMPLKVSKTYPFETGAPGRVPGDGRR